MDATSLNELAVEYRESLELSLLAIVNPSLIKQKLIELEDDLHQSLDYGDLEGEQRDKAVYMIGAVWTQMDKRNIPHH